MDPLVKEARESTTDLYFHLIISFIPSFLLFSSPNHRPSDRWYHLADYPRIFFQFTIVLRRGWVSFCRCAARRHFEFAVFYVYIPAVTPSPNSLLVARGCQFLSLPLCFILINYFLEYLPKLFCAHTLLAAPTPSLPSGHTRPKGLHPPSVPPQEFPATSTPPPRSTGWGPWGPLFCCPQKKLLGTFAMKLTVIPGHLLYGGGGAEWYKIC